MKSRQGETTALQRVLSWRPLTFIGGFGYSLYLVHLPLLILFMGLAHIARLHAVPDQLVNLCFVAFGLPIILLMSYGFFLAFERPFLRSQPVGACQTKTRHVLRLAAASLFA